MNNSIEYNFENILNQVNLLIKDMNSVDEVSFILQKYISLIPLDIIEQAHHLIENKQFVIFKNVGNEIKHLLIISSIFSQAPYYSNRMKCIISESKADPYVYKTNQITEFTDYGAFHTDFSPQISIPDLIAIQCVKPDPKYPHFAMNQIVDINKIFSKIEKLYAGFTKHCLNLTIPCRFPSGHIQHIKFLEFNEITQKLVIKLHMLYIADDLLEEKHFIDDYPIYRIINAVATELAEEFVLNKNDIVVFSNKYALHKRAETTVKFNTSLDDFDSRETRSIRLYIS